MTLPTVSTLPAVMPVAQAASEVPGWGAAGLLQAALGLALVVGLILLCGWAARRFGLQQVGGGRQLKVVSSVSVGQRERVVLVDVQGTRLLLGVAPGQVRMLHTLPVSADRDGA